MQIIFDSQNKSILKVEKGEDCINVLKELAQKRNSSFHFSMIGACSLAELGYFSPKTKKYSTKEFTTDSIEILSFNGNVAWDEEKPIVHAHGVFSSENYECFGGHVVKLIISLTGELIIHWLPIKLVKKYDEETGLKLLSV